MRMGEQIKDSQQYKGLNISFRAPYSCQEGYTLFPDPLDSKTGALAGPEFSRTDVRTLCLKGSGFAQAQQLNDSATSWIVSFGSLAAYSCLQNPVQSTTMLHSCSILRHQRKPGARGPTTAWLQRPVVQRLWVGVRHGVSKAYSDSETPMRCSVLKRKESSEEQSTRLPLSMPPVQARGPVTSVCLWPCRRRPAQRGL
jgi:hypothetical protein